MKLIENATFVGEMITIDDCHLINSRLEKCKIYYSGGDFALTGTSFVDCEIILLGAAHRTSTLIRAIRVDDPTGGTERDTIQ